MAPCLYSGPYSREDARREVNADLKDFSKSYNGEVKKWQAYSAGDGYQSVADGGRDYYYDSLTDMVDHIFPDAEHLGRYDSLKECIEKNLDKLNMEKKTIYVKRKPEHERRNIDDLMVVLTGEHEKAGNEPRGNSG